MSDLSVLKDMPLTQLDCSFTKVADLAPLKDMRLTTLFCRGAKVADLSPLLGMPLTELGCDFKRERDAEILPDPNAEDGQLTPGGGVLAGSGWPSATAWSLDFDGNGRVDLPSLTLKVDEPLTVEAWVTPRVQTSQKSTVFRVGWISQMISRKWDLWLPQSNPKLKEAWRGFWSDQEFSPGQRTHVAAVWSGKEIDLYVNGQLQEAHDAVMVPKEFNPQFFLGDMFKGQFHQFRVSKARQYTGHTAPISDRFDSDDKTLLLYRFDEGQGDKLTDSSGNGHDGKIVGAKWVKADGTPIRRPAGSPCLFLAIRPFMSKFPD